MRINKYIASAGICSRRKADELIRKGKVKVNGITMTEPGFDVYVPGEESKETGTAGNAGADGSASLAAGKGSSTGARGYDEVTVNGEPIEINAKKLYYVLNKPTGCVTSVTDDRGRMTVLDLFDDVDARLFPVGRLDYNTGGVLFVTNDGDFAYRLTHPKHEIDKVYRVRIAGTITKEAVAKLRHGVDIGGYVTKRARVDVLSWTKHSTLLEVTIHEGKNRQVRKMFKAVGKNVEELTRITDAGIGLGHLKPGQYRKLNPDEVAKLMSL